MRYFKIRNKKTGEFWNGRFWNKAGKTYLRMSFVISSICSTCSKDLKNYEVIEYELSEIEITPEEIINELVNKHK